MRGLRQRPENFRMNYGHSLAKGLVFAGLGRKSGSVRYVDSSSYGNYGTLTAMDPATDWVWADTLNRACLDMDGGDDEVSIPSSVWNGLIGTKTISVAAWYYPTSIASYRGFIDSGTSSSTRSLLLSVNTTSAGWVAYAGGVGNSCAFSPQFTTSEWQYIVYGGTASSIFGYRNGVSFLSTAGTPGSGFTSNYISIGGNPTEGSSHYVGRVCDVLVWSRTLSVAEIQQLADPSNVMYSGLVLPPKRKYYPIIYSTSTQQFLVFKSNNRFFTFKQ